MGQRLGSCCRRDKVAAGRGSQTGTMSGGRNFDPDEKWSNLYREREKNHLYKWVGVRSGGELVTVYEKEGEEGVLRFAAEKLEPMMYENGEKTQLIKFADYVRWKKVSMDGETIIHLLLNREEPSCAEIARILISKYPGLAKDIYMGNEICCWRRERRSTLRACGDFFLPEDVTDKNSRTTSYQGYAYYGEYPLAFAACFGNKDIYDLLIQYGANPDLQDMFGNTCLHMCVINYSSSMYSYAVRHWHKPAKTNIVNNAGYTPLTLGHEAGPKAHLRGDAREFWRFSDMTCSAYPLDTLDTIRPDGSTNYDSALMTVINGSTSEHLDMIGSEVIQRLLADKWKAFAARKMYERLGLLAFHLVCLCFVVYLRPTETKRLYMDEPEWDDYVRTVFEVLTILSCVWFVFGQQVGDLRTQGFVGYFKNLTTAPAKIVYLVANICLLLCVPFRFSRHYDIEEGLLIFSLPGSWIFLLFFARSAKLTGPFVQMIYSMIAVFYFVGKDMAAKQALPKNNNDKCHIEGYNIYTYSSFLETFVTLFRASMGGYDYEEFACTNYEPLTKTLFVLYMFVMPIMMINILIAMMGNTYTTVITQAEKAWRQQYAKILMVLERSVNKEKLAMCQLEYSIKLNEASRGLMVIKQTRKTRARQRKQAINNWKKIKHNVMKMVEKYGAEQTKFLLHSHDRIILEETVTGNVDAAAAAVAVNLARNSTNRTPSRSESEQKLADEEEGGYGRKQTIRGVLAAHKQKGDSEQPRAATADSIALPTVDTQSVSGYHEARTSRESAGGSASSSPTHKPHGYVHVTQRTLAAAAGVRVRGVQMLPSVDVPNIPGQQRSSGSSGSPSSNGSPPARNP
ncbi:Inactive [Aphelenchoides fujianensis]|nr:Inactive [Aphelenchoides fujianensis]